MASRKFTILTAALLLGGGVARADVSISSKPTQNMSCDSGVCTATAPKAVLNVGDLQTMLAGGDVAVKTGTLAKDIDIAAPLTWSNTSRLTLDAQQSVTIKKQVTVSGTGALTITTNDGGKNGEFVIMPERGSVQFWDTASSLIIDGNNYTLVNDIKTLAVDIAANPSGFYALAKPYDASGDGTYTASPVGTPFQGTLEGLGNAVRSLSINSQGGAVGFLGGVNSPGAVRDLEITRASISLHTGSAGILVGAGNFGQVVRCRVSGQISASAAVGVGGLVSENEGVIVESGANVRITGTGFSGAAGGITGYNDGNITSSYALRAIAQKFGNGLSVGGLAGENTGIIQNSYARNSINDGKQNESTSVGGLVGKNATGAQIINAYAAGDVNQHSAAAMGGVVGLDDSAPGNINHSYWDLDMGISDPSQGAGNIPNDPGITGLTTKQFQKGLPKGFSPKVWGSDPSIDKGFPYLRSNVAK